MLKKFFLIVAATLLLPVTTALAAPIVSGPAMDAGVQPTADAGGNVTIPPLPGGRQLVGVYVWNDSLGAAERDLGPRHTFKLNPGDGFNFIWSGPEGKRWQLVTPATKPGGSLIVDTSWRDAQGVIRCKYLYPEKK